MSLKVTRGECSFSNRYFVGYRFWDRIAPFGVERQQAAFVHLQQTDDLLSSVCAQTDGIRNVAIITTSSVIMWAHMSATAC